MTTFNELMILSAIMGMSIFLSLPIVLKKAMGSKTVALLNAGAIGILVFLVADVYSNAAVIIFPSGYVGDERAMGLFLLGFLVSFFLLFAMARPSPGAQATSPNSVALIVAVAIGFQNLTEGLVFGASWALGLSGVLLVIFAGFFLQNVTEGFPICAPYLGSDRPPVRRLAGYFLIGGLPTIGGGAFGYYWNSAYLDVFFDALAIGAIAYALLPMIRTAFRPATTPQETRVRQDMVYIGLAVGFAVGFLVNAI
jgi:zinc transporter, ZIP family